MEDKQLVEEVFVNAIDVLSKEDQKLPQVENLLPLLKRGIGIHHGGEAFHFNYVTCTKSAYYIITIYYFHFIIFFRFATTSEGNN